MTNQKSTKNKAVKPSRQLFKKVGKYSVVLMLVALAVPSVAMAATTSAFDIKSLMNMLKNGVTLLGGVFIIWGAIQLGLALKDGASGGGTQLAGAIAMIVGGAVVMAAALWFGTIDTTI